MSKSTTKSTHALDYIFYPRSVGVVGLSQDSGAIANNILLRSLLELDFRGEIYPIHPRMTEFMGLRVYPSIMDTPGPIDHLIVSIPAQSTPELIEDCAAKGVKVVSLYTANFSESGSDEGKSLEVEITEIARRAGIRVIGPNCLGLYCPRSGLSFSRAASRESGPVGFVCQSGGIALQLIENGPARGVYFSKAISYGNACDLSEADFLEYFTEDPETRVITAYIEGIEDGPRFAKSLAAATSVKPVIVVKGGTTDAGTRAIASHTGSLAGERMVWNTICKQTGVIPAVDMEELTDLLVTFLFMRPLQGLRVGVLGAGGGASVLAIDACERAGLTAPPLPPKVRQEIQKHIYWTGTNLSNPIDSGLPTLSHDAILGTIQAMASSDAIDLALVHTGVHIKPSPQMLAMLEEQAEGIIQAHRECGKPIAMVVHPTSYPERAEIGFDLEQKYIKAGLPVYPSVSRAANAIAKYHQSTKEKR